MSTELPTLTLEEFKNAIKEISQFELESKKEQQKHFIFKLIETNNELRAEINGIKAKGDSATFEEKEDFIFFQETVLENKHFLLEQLARVGTIDDELVDRNIISEAEKKAEEERLLKYIAVEDAKGNKSLLSEEEEKTDREEQKQEEEEEEEEEQEQEQEQQQEEGVYL